MTSHEKIAQASAFMRDLTDTAPPREPPPARACPDCGVAVNEPHRSGCDVERCMLCGGQLLSCNCVYELAGIDPATMEKTHPTIYTEGATDEMWTAYDAAVAAIGGPGLWTGEWPGDADARRLGVFSRWVNLATSEPMAFASGVPGKWQPCLATDADARPDLNRLHSAHFTWSRERRQWENPR